MRSTSFGASARKAFPAEWLSPDDSANLVPVDIVITDIRRLEYPLPPPINACMQPHREAVTACVDIINHCINIISIKPRDMQDMPKNFPLHRTNP